MIDRTVVRLNNVAVKLRRTRCRPEELLVLFSRCLQRSACECNVGDDLENCKRCGRCAVADFLRLRDEYGVRVFMATGGRHAVERARDPEIKAIVAVACEKELKGGIFASLPKAVLAAEIAWPVGPCKDTTVDIRRVEEAVRWFLR